MSDERDRAGAAFWIGSAAGTAIAGFGVWGLLHNLHGPALTSYLKTFAGGLIVHDGFFAPLVVAGAFLLVRVIPRRFRGPAQSALIVSGALIAISIPILTGYGRLPNNPSLLPSHHYLARLLAILAAVWVIAALVAVVQRRRSARPQQG